MPRGIPHSVFMGRVVGPGEPMWLPEDADLALEWQAEQDITCKGCGQPVDESTATASEGGYEGHAVVCFGCRELRQHASGFESDALAATKFYVTKAAAGGD